MFILEDQFLFCFTVGTVRMAYTALVAGLLGSSTRTFGGVEFSFCLGLMKLLSLLKHCPVAGTSTM